MRYRACQRTYRESVGVFGSHIHGLGLFCLQEIDSGDMVIEYAGTVIRSTLTDYRERFYESKGIGCYMFRIDSDEVVDATMSGNMARFINHSCEVGVVGFGCHGYNVLSLLSLSLFFPSSSVPSLALA